MTELSECGYVGVGVCLLGIRYPHSDMDLHILRLFKTQSYKTALKNTQVTADRYTKLYITMLYLTIIPF